MTQSGLMNLLIICFVILLAALESLSACPSTDDPCRSDVYSILDEPLRSTGYYGTGDGSGDTDLSNGWYRSVSGAGGDMPTEPVESEQCNSIRPIWLDGNLPGSQDGVVAITGCVTYLFNSCESQFEVCVKNCSTFNVYYLSRTTYASQSYCIGSDVACQEGETSPNGFTPGCTADITTNDPSTIDPIPSVTNPSNGHDIATNEPATSLSVTNPPNDQDERSQTDIRTEYVTRASTTEDAPTEDPPLDILMIVFVAGAAFIIILAILVVILIALNHFGILFKKPSANQLSVSSAANQIHPVAVSYTLPPKPINDVDLKLDYDE